MAQKSLKPLIANLRKGHQEGDEYKWNKLQNPRIFIENIITPDISVETDLNKIISGIPSSFARINMFRYALEYIKDTDNGPTGLMAFYDAIIDEWKGLIACIALDSAPITIEKIELAYSDGKSIDETQNIFEMKGSLGNMLFADRDLWCDKNDLEDQTKKAVPFIYLIRYKGELIGGTSPYSIIFTAPQYNIKPNLNLINQNGRFTDPLSAHLEPEHIQILYTYVNHIKSKLADFQNYFGSKGKQINIGRIYNILDKWLKEMEDHSKSRKFKLIENAIVTNVNLFNPPYDTLFNTQTKLYGYNGIVSLTKISDKAVEIDPTKLLLPHDTTTVVQFDFANEAEAEKNPVFYLEAESAKGKMYFSLPFSEEGLIVFQDYIYNLLYGGNKDTIKSKLNAIYDHNKKQLIVNLTLDINGNETKVNRVYTDPVIVSNKQVIIWPDFVSGIWNRYYCYSELPHNGTGSVKAFPLRADKTDFRLLTNDNKNKFQYIATDDHIPAKDEQTKLMVEFDFDKLGAIPLKYEIYQSEEPIKGLEFRISKGTMDNRPAGYVLLKDLNRSYKKGIKDYRNSKISLQTKVNVGIDFGSNNLCISYYAKGFNEPKLIKFNNRRLFLIGNEKDDPKGKMPAKPHEVFFFQNEAVMGNAVKSMIMIHDERRIDGENAIPDEVSGGFPCFEKNIPVIKSSNTEHEVDFGTFKARMKYNMKWSLDDKENKYKEALLKTLWLKIYAELLDEEMCPQKLIWAYPSSMGNEIVKKYRTLWQSVGLINPVRHPEERPDAIVADHDRSSDQSFTPALCEAEAVYRYALSMGGMDVGKETLAIGCDVGGSTTDIMFIAQVKEKDEFKSALVKQSSFKIAAGKLAEATSKSIKLQKALKSFSSKYNIFIYGIDEKLNSNTAPYFFNTIVDALGAESEEQLKRFYNHLYAEGDPGIFIINAYLTGIILYYCGQLSAKITKHNGFNDIKNFEIGFYGKGGRMFKWLPALSQSSAEKYFQQCFNDGFEPNGDITFKPYPGKPGYVKSEVSFGLSFEKKIETAKLKIAEIVGEEGYKYDNDILNILDDVEPKHLMNFNKQLSIPKEFKRFNRFISIFSEFIKHEFNFDISSFEKDLKNLNISNYVQNIPEFREAMNTISKPEEFDFEAPLIIIEAMCFLDNVLMEKIK